MNGIIVYRQTHQPRIMGHRVNIDRHQNKWHEQVQFDFFDHLLKNKFYENNINNIIPDNDTPFSPTTVSIPSESEFISVSRAQSPITC